MIVRIYHKSRSILVCPSESVWWLLSHGSVTLHTKTFRSNKGRFWMKNTIRHRIELYARPVAPVKGQRKRKRFRIEFDTFHYKSGEIFDKFLMAKHQENRRKRKKSKRNKIVKFHVNVSFLVSVISVQNWCAMKWTKWEARDRLIQSNGVGRRQRTLNM